jgi:hypothetical protein
MAEPNKTWAYNPYDALADDLADEDCTGQGSL